MQPLAGRELSRLLAQPVEVRLADVFESRHTTAQHRAFPQRLTHRPGLVALAKGRCERSAQDEGLVFVHRGFRRHLIEKMAWGLPIVALISVGAAWALPRVFWRLFSLSVICCTAAGYLLEKWCERSARQEIVEERGVESVARSEAAVA